MAEKTYKCVLCKKRFTGYGNNAEPIKKGRCCDACNQVVVMARIVNLKKEK